MRVFANPADALDEIRRDVYKGVELKSSRVQNFDGLDLNARERWSYNYSIVGGWPEEASDYANIVMKAGYTYWADHGHRIVLWLRAEEYTRINPEYHLNSATPNEYYHPALKKVKEGDHWGYTYVERLYGAMGVLKAILKGSPDSRRAYWPIFNQTDALRAMSPTRVPCSLGYQAMIRKIGGEDALTLFYFQRSADLDVFFPSDVWLAHRFQLELANQLDLPIGPFIHYITSFHSFMAGGEEIY